MKLRPHPVSYNGQPLAADEFAFTHSAAGIDGLVYHCRGNPPRPRMCRIAIRLGKPEDGVHGWDGNLQKPTITPSVGCDARPGCKWHGQIVKGDWTP